MDSYILRIYRRIHSPRRDIAGVVVRPESDKQQSFRSAGELLSILVEEEGAAGEKKRPQGKDMK